MITISKFDKYKMNLQRIDNFIYSYTTLVAIIEGNTLRQLGTAWSRTTQKHINYVAKELDLKLIK